MINILVVFLSVTLAEACLRLRLAYRGEKLDDDERPWVFGLAESIWNEQRERQMRVLAAADAAMWSAARDASERHSSTSSRDSRSLV